VACLALAALSVPRASRAQTVPSGFVDETVVGGLTEGVAFAFLPDGRVLIAEKAGLVRVLKNGALLATPFIDLRSRVNAYWDRGLVGLAADPSFATNGFVYFYYVYENNPNTYTGPKTARLTRVTASGDTAALSSEVVLLGNTTASSCNALPAGADCIPADSPSHNGGAVRFASDGTLFLATGDGAHWNIVDDNALRSQDLDSLGGKLLHVTKAGAGVSTNPFWNGSAG
jgi:glucose/arabinose dehydrogenase